MEWLRKVSQPTLRRFTPNFSSHKSEFSCCEFNNIEHYRPLTEPMVQETHNRVLQLINELHDYNHIDEMTNKWLCQTPNLPRIPIFHTLTKIHKLTPVRRPIISGCDGPTEKLSACMDKLLRPITQKQQSYLKDTSVFIIF